MKTFAEFVKEGNAVKASPDPAEARSLFSQAKERLLDIQSLPLNERNASFRFEDAYEVIREALQAFLAIEGYKPYSHEAVLSFALERKILSEAGIRRSDRYREIRNDINYRGKTVTLEEAREIISFAALTVPELEKKFGEAKWTRSSTKSR